MQHKFRSRKEFYNKYALLCIRLYVHVTDNICAFILNSLYLRLYVINVIYCILGIFKRIKRNYDIYFYRFRQLDYFILTVIGSGIIHNYK